MRRVAVGILFVWAYFVDSTLADSFFFPNNTFGPSAEFTAGVSPSCQNAILANVSCDSNLITLISSDFYGNLANDTLQAELCTPACSQSLTAYRSSVVLACASDPLPFPGLPASYFGDVADATYTLMCLRDSATGTFCTDFISQVFGNLTDDSDVSNIPPSQLCSECIVNLFRHIQSTPYSNYGDSLVPQWSFIQSQCSLNFNTTVSALQTSVTNLPGYAPPNSSYSGGCLSRNTYTVVSGDDCQVIAQKENVATGTLISVNNLLRDCSNLELGSTLCLPQNCTTYLVQPGDTCYSIADAKAISFPQFMAYNPSINRLCTNLISAVNVCISPPGGTWSGTMIVGTTATQTAVFATATVAPPGIVAHGTTTHCGKYYQVQPGDFCQIITLNQTISLALFEAINPDVNAGCSNLVPGLFYCVQPTADWNGTITGGTTTTSMTVPPPTATPPGTTNQCFLWHTVVSGDSCALIASSFGITFTQFQSWNPNLLDNCTNLILGDAYCVDGASSGSSATPTITSSATVPPPTVTPPGTTNQCFLWHTVVAGDSCSSIESSFGITFSQLQSWNPNLLSNCTNLLLGEAYCVSGPTSAQRQRSWVESTVMAGSTRNRGGVPVGWPYPLSGRGVGY